MLSHATEQRGEREGQVVKEGQAKVIQVIEGSKPQHKKSIIVIGAKLWAAGGRDRWMTNRPLYFMRRAMAASLRGRAPPVTPVPRAASPAEAALAFLEKAEPHSGSISDWRPTALSTVPAS